MAVSPLPLFLALPLSLASLGELAGAAFLPAAPPLLPTDVEAFLTGLIVLATVLLLLGASFFA